jgi:MFS family permease
MGLACKSKSEVALIGTMFFIGMLITVGFLPRLSDKYGRWMIVNFCQFITFGALSWLVFATQITQLYGIMFILGCATAIRFSISFMYMVEISPQAKSILIGSIWNVSEGVVIMKATFYFQFISRHWVYYICFNAFLALFAATVSFCLIRESPVFTYDHDKPEETRKTMLFIAKFNGSKGYSEL